MTAATAICDAQGVLTDWLDACILDVSLTGDSLFATELALAPAAPTAFAVQEPQCAEPSFAPVGGEVDAGTWVALSAPNLPQSGVIAYTTDGTAPTESSAAYSAPIQVHQNETLRAIAFAPGACTDSPIAAATYVTTPFAGPPQISGVSPQTVVAGGEMIISGSNLAAASGDTTDVTVALFPAGDAGSPIPLSIASGSAGQLVVNTPADAYELAPGTVNVTVSTPDGVASSQVTVIPVASTCGAACPDGSGCQYTIAPVYGEGQTCRGNHRHWVRAARAGGPP